MTVVSDLIISGYVAFARPIAGIKKKNQKPNFKESTK